MALNLWTSEAQWKEDVHLGFVSLCIFKHSNELIPTRCSN